MTNSYTTKNKYAIGVMDMLSPGQTALPGLEDAPARTERYVRAGRTSEDKRGRARASKRHKLSLLNTFLIKFKEES